MNRAPRFPTNALLALLALLGDGAAVACLIFSDVPLALKISIGAMVIFIPFAVVIFFLGERRGWMRQRRRILELEHELRALTVDRSENRIARGARRRAA